MWSMTRTMDKVIDTRLVYGFLDAGKTTYIRENIQGDVFYKYGSTLILSFEEGEEDFDPVELQERRTSVEFYDGSDIREFCLKNIEDHQPDRIYVEMNTMIPDLREEFPECMRVTFSMMLIDWSTMPVYYANFMQLFKQMTSSANQVVFRGCPSNDLLKPYSQAFRLMNPKATYLRRDPMGYHEKAFEMFLPYSLDGPVITITEKEYLTLWLDAFDHPEHYDGKTLRLTDPVEIRKREDNGRWSLGRVVMTCCMADLQFMAFDLDVNASEEKDLTENGWVTADASASLSISAFGQRKLILKPKEVLSAAAPAELILDGRKNG